MRRTRFPAPATNPSDDRNRSAGPESFRGCRSLRTDDAKRSSLQNRAGHWRITTPQRMDSSLRFDPLPGLTPYRSHIESVQITMAEDFGVQGRGAFYEQVGAVRDVVQNHHFQVLANLAMEPPIRTDSESIRDEKVKVLKAMSPLD